ncbi:hypothetical protein M427DRAFT_212313 [Gonapodya prolifera JEL478]|uniref:Uncharacterized protein n=1 Tax=Gonapodya prolifera (strain JEL478) TaxID=1344416 RepID=A0A139AP35_GONPJ|nr:hypothetical protein M427DRAFT_212313 [Gonapodya prolifera JEL478]|eukprot:KXS18517.1 hypothetical protein M427DRAFT_212313 [Gonapodya prolifera JEL478]
MSKMHQHHPCRFLYGTLLWLHILFSPKVETASKRRIETLIGGVNSIRSVLRTIPHRGFRCVGEEHESWPPNQGHVNSDLRVYANVSKGLGMKAVAKTLTQNQEEAVEMMALKSVIPDFNYNTKIAIFLSSLDKMKLLTKVVT